MAKLAFVFLPFLLLAQDPSPTPVTGKVLDPQGRAVARAVVKLADGLGRTRSRVTADNEGADQLMVLGAGPYALVAEAPGFDPVTTELRSFDGKPLTLDLNLGQLSKAETVLTVTERVIEPTVDQRDQEIFAKTLFTRDDQIFQTLGSGLSLGQHAGGGKSLEVRRFGFNLDHGGTGGGLKVVVDNIQQNQVSGGHAHGYLGALKGLSPEIVENVTLINGPFSALYGDFSSLGVVNIKTRDDFNERVTGRVQFGEFGTRRLFGAYSPNWKNASGYLAHEYSYSDGPFQFPLNYLRNNTTAVFTRKLRANETAGVRAYGQSTDFNSAGQLPLEEIEAGRIGRFDAIDPTDGGDQRSTTLAGRGKTPMAPRSGWMAWVSGCSLICTRTLPSSSMTRRTATASSSMTRACKAAPRPSIRSPISSPAAWVTSRRA